MFMCSVHLAKFIFANLFFYSSYFCYYLWILLHFLILFIGLTILFQLTFNLFTVFSTKSFQFQQNKRNLKVEENIK